MSTVWSMPAAVVVRMVWSCSVIYMCASLVVREVLDLYMSRGSAEPVSRTMLNFSGICMFVLLPLSDSLDPAFAGPRAVRVFATMGAAIKLYCIAWCKSSPETCRALYHDYNMTVASGTAFNDTGNGTGNNAAVLTEHVIFSTLDLMCSLDFVIFVLSLQVFACTHACHNICQ